MARKGECPHEPTHINMMTSFVLISMHSWVDIHIYNEIWIKDSSTHHNIFIIIIVPLRTSIIFSLVIGNLHDR